MALVLLLVAAAWAEPYEDRCYRCHGQSWIAQRSPTALAAMVRAPEGGERRIRDVSEIPGLLVPGEAFAASAHGGLSCSECHPGVDTLPHNQVVESLSCVACHAGAANDVAMGMHAPTVEGTPTCAHCHGDAHAIRKYGGPRTFARALEMVERCSACHGDVSHGKFSPAETFHDSIHGEALFKKGLVSAPLCTDCHGPHAMFTAADPRSPVHPLNVPQTCGACHQGIVPVFLNSVHGRNLQAGRADAASCTSCHHSHGVAGADTTFAIDVVAECSHCHIKLGESYLRSYHGKATQLGGRNAAVCSKCHGAHDIQPASDPTSRIAAGNLVATCGECHPGANENFVKYIAHVDYTDRSQNPVVFFTFWGMTILLCSVLLVFIPHSLLWFQRTLGERLRSKGHGRGSGRMVRRFNRMHRLTHALIIISFMGLVATGFPLKYSYTGWAQAIASLFGGIHAMGILHRLFAVVTFAYAGLHLGFLAWFFWKKCPAPRWRYIIGPDSMLFSLKDFKDFIAMMKWFFRRGPRPQFDRWTYFEKFDYWGEIWGVIVIGGSGLLLWFPTLFTKVLPGWILNVAMVIHSIEALLAASVIFLVHFFNTHLRPERFPIDLTMWSGQMTEEEMKIERPAEYARLVESGALEERLEEPISARRRLLGIVLGMTAFLIGIALIVLAIQTEILNLVK
jgi:cytochrome b subunit of formate dehydrogenase